LWWRYDSRVPWGWQNARPIDAMGYIERVVFSEIGESPARVLDVGSGNGYLANRLTSRGFVVTGVEADEVGVEIARENCPDATFLVGNAMDLRFHEEFDWVVSTEVVEHLYDPGAFANGCFRALKPGGQLLVSTPYHGYAKNLAIALANGWDKHLHPLRVGGHIKFWSRQTMGALLEEAGFTDIRFRGAGRVPYLWKSDVAVARRP
jgi:2-polyprenyl-3-methyl-5-hydroxy-6-metoxy-1,4-benzoquinol methylase